ncbi:allantoinase AllB [Puniceicoccaceae bacterium K14]|nr:allantoinase AllB [Puniceicoccaceae bacterium K14]
MHDLIVHDVKILEHGEWVETDIAIHNGSFSSIGSTGGAAKTIIDANGSYCVPGGVDLHVHFNEPGRTEWEGFATGSRAAAAGGITFVSEMPLNSIPSTVSVDALNDKLDAIGSQSSVDFALWGGLVPGNVQDLQPLANAGVIGFKAFMSPSGTDDFENSDTATLRAGMAEIAKTGKVLAIHAEDPRVLKAAEARVLNKTSAYHWENSRPVEAEIEAIKTAVDLAGETGCRIHIVHISSSDALSFVSQGKQNGIDVTCETCPHYLLLSVDDSYRLGPTAKCAPPLRQPTTVGGLWNSIRNNEVNTIGSDHSPCPIQLKSGAHNFYEAWGGISGLQHGLPLLWDACMGDLKLFQKIMDLSTSNASDLIGLKSKGKLELGRDADFVLFESLDIPTGISQEELLYKNAHSAYCGSEISLKVKGTWLRGKCIYGEESHVELPFGRFLRF